MDGQRRDHNLARAALALAAALIASACGAMSSAPTSTPGASAAAITSLFIATPGGGYTRIPDTKVGAGVQSFDPKATGGPALAPRGLKVQAKRAWSSDASYGGELTDTISEFSTEADASQYLQSMTGPLVIDGYTFSPTPAGITTHSVPGVPSGIEQRYSAGRLSPGGLDVAVFVRTNTYVVVLDFLTYAGTVTDSEVAAIARAQYVAIPSA